jgi:glycosyltransferase involved in cell wall biosynthesis
MEAATRMPRVSICIPAFAQVDCLRRTLQSVLEQDFRDYEIIVTDDSRDNSVAMLVQSMNFAGRMRFFRNEAKLGSPENWNEAVRRATGDYIKIMHHDDYFSSPYSLGRYVQALDERADVDFVFSASRGENIETREYFHHCVGPETLKKIRTEPAATLFCGNAIGSPSATIYRRAVSLDYDNKMKWLVDVDFYIRVLQRSSALTYIPEPLVTISANAPHQVTADCRNNGHVELPEHARLFAKIFNDVSADPKVESRWIELFDLYGIDDPGDLARYGVEQPMPPDYFALLLKWHRRERFFLRLGPQPWAALPALKRGESWPMRFARRMSFLAAYAVYAHLPESAKMLWRRGKRRSSSAL